MAPIIENLKLKIKYFLEKEELRDVLIIIILILTGLISFELGRLSKNDQNTGIILKGDKNSVLEQKYANYTDNKIITDSKLVNKNYFASSKGKKYYSIGCSAGKDIKQENRIYFESKEAAELAGYSLSSSCR